MYVEKHLGGNAPQCMAGLFGCTAWLQRISRDRAGAYAEGATMGAPQAQQVADRWHLLSNLGEALVKVFQGHSRELRTLPSGILDTVLPFRQDIP